MRRTRRSRRRLPLLLLPLLFAFACDGGNAAPVARPHELRLTIVHGKGMRDTVRSSKDPADLLQDDSVVVQVWAQLDAGGSSTTGPGRDARIPPVEIVWRTLEPWCRAERSTTPVGPGNTASNRLHVPTVAADCRLVAEGVVNGFVFGSDTTVAGFAPGPIASFDVQPLVSVIVAIPRSIRTAVGRLRDEHDNSIDGPPDVTLALTQTQGPPAITVADDTLIRATAEGVATATVRGGTATRTTQIMALRDLNGEWRLSWACYDAPLAGGAHADSARYLMDPAEARYGGVSGRGPVIRFLGTLTTRMWVRGEPVRESSVINTTRFASQSVGTLEWAPGQVATTTATGYAGGSLCEPGPEGSTWARSSPAIVTFLRRPAFLHPHAP
jgi:hypothetical protein